MSLVLLHSPADIIRWLLVAKSEGTSPLLTPLQPWPIYRGNEPTVPDECLTVYDTTAQADGRSMIDGETWRHEGIQVRIRAADYTPAFAKARSIARTLDESVYNDTVAIDGHHYLVHSVSGTNLLVLGKGVPDSKRNLCTVNGLVALRRLD